MAERIYTRSESGSLEPLEEERFSSEETLQELIAQHPELLDGEQMRPDDPRRWILVSREQGIAEELGGAARWSLDHLLIDQDAVPTLVEVKRGANSEVRRTVVGQMLDYAAHAPQVWTADKLRQDFAQSVLDPDQELQRLLQADDELDVEGFWQDVATNLAAKRLRLLFVADAIPDELAHIVEFLNEQMPHIEVLAVELKRFRGGSTQTLVPRVIGRTAGSSRTTSSGAAGPRRRLDREGFLEALGSEDVRTAATRLLDAAESCGAHLTWRATSVSIRATCQSWRKPVTVAWIYVPSSTTSWGGQSQFTFGATLWNEDMPSGVQQFFQDWAVQFAADDFANDISWQDVPCWMVRYEDAVTHVELLEERLRAVLTQLQNL